MGLSTAAAIDKMTAQLCKLLAKDPPDGNFTTVYQAPNWSFGTIAGGSTVANSFLTDSWKMFQDAANMLEASQRYQGAEYAGDTASQTLQINAFNTALSGYTSEKQAVSTDLQAYLTELQGSVSDVNLATDSSLANLQVYLGGLANPLTNDSFLASLITYIDSSAPNLSGVINADLQQAVTALENTQAPTLSGTAFSIMSAAADQLVAIQAPSFPLDQVYTSVLQRSASNAEAASAASLEATLGPAGLIASIVDSPEAQHNVYPIAQIVQLATGNMPTTAQLAGWVPFVESNGLLQGNLQSNPLLDQMAEAFVASTQFGNTYNGGTAVNPNAPITATIVSAVIQAATGVAATQAQIDAWLATGQTIDQVFVDFALGDQYSAHIQSAVQQFFTSLADQAASSGGLGVSTTITPNDGMTAAEVEGAYQAVLQRLPSRAETNAALSIDSSIGNVGALVAIVDSPEAQANVYPIAQIVELATGNMPTTAQLAGWVPFVESNGLLQGNLQSNPLLDQMAEAFVASAQFGNTYNAGTAVNPNAPISASIVSAIIQAATGAAATEAQVNAWLATGQTIDQVFVDFALGDQYSTFIQNAVESYLDATAINAAGLTIVDGINATGILTLSTPATALTANNLTVLGGSGLLNLVATGNGDTITQLNTSIAGGTITASGDHTTINTANGTSTITANGAGDTINLGVLATGTAITSAQTIHASGAGDTITFATKAADAIAITWGAASTLDGGAGTTGIGPDSSVNFGNNTGSGSEAVVVTGDLSGATTSGGTTITGIAMITLGNVHDAGGDQIIFNNAAIEVLVGSVNVSSAMTLAHAFDMAAADAAASQGGSIAAHTGVIDWFEYQGDTYVLEAINPTSSAAGHSALAATDEVIKILGLVSLANESFAAHSLTL
jgi:hypothetical protein